VGAAMWSSFLDPDSLSRAWAQRINPRDSLARNDGHSFFEALGDAIVTGPTLTNVNDFRAVLITGDAQLSLSGKA
jgi:glycerate 2-kinase